MLLAAGCERETRRFRESPPAATSETAVSMSELQPGPKTQACRPCAERIRRERLRASPKASGSSAPYNCSGCHSHGGGGIGPALMDDEWIYGSDPENIFATIVEGRPNGMPTFRGQDPQPPGLAARGLRALAEPGSLPKHVAPSRRTTWWRGPSRSAPRRRKPKQASDAARLGAPLMRRGSSRRSSRPVPPRRASTGSGSSCGGRRSSCSCW